MDDLGLDAIPFPLRWERAPEGWTIEGSGVLTITSGPGTDLFVDPRGTSAHDNAPRLLFTPSLPFLLSARVAVDFRDTFDAGGLLVRIDADRWAKLCFE